jgi:hypothetical protein
MFNFVDAVQMNKKYPNTFQLPLRKDILKLEAGNYVKICHNEERFWVIVKEIDGDKIKGIVNNDLVCEQPFKCDDTIEFEKRHIYQVAMEPKPCRVNTV